MRFCNNCGKKNSNNSNFCEECGNRLSSTNQVHKVEENNKPRNKNLIITIVSSIVVIVLLAGGLYWFFSNSSSKEEKSEFMKKYTSAIMLIKNGELEKGKSELELLEEKDKYDDVDVSTDLKVISELDKIEKSILNNDKELSTKIENFKKEYTGKYDTFKSFVDSFLKDAEDYTKFTSELDSIKEKIKSENYDEAKSELEKLKSYKFNSKKITESTNKEFEKLLEELDGFIAKQEKIKQEEANKKAEQAKVTSAGGVSDDDVLPLGSSYVFSGTVTDSTTYKEFRQTNAYQMLASNYIGYNASNYEIKVLLEWLIQKGREGAHVLPTPEEYRERFGR